MLRKCTYTDSVNGTEPKEKPPTKHTNTMNTLEQTTEKFGEEYIPEWALCYLINGEDDSLTDGDIETIKQGLARHGIKEVFCPADEEESSFTWRPMFGLACNEILCLVEYL